MQVVKQENSKELMFFNDLVRGKLTEESMYWYMYIVPIKNTIPFNQVKLGRIKSDANVSPNEYTKPVVMYVELEPTTRSGYLRVSGFRKRTYSSCVISPPFTGSKLHL